MDKVKILFLAADPSDAVRLRLGQELRDVREKLQLSKQRDSFLLESRESARPGDLTQAILEMEPQVVHFSGHGMKTGELCFENFEGKTQVVQMDALASLFELVSKDVQCVVLNACYSASQASIISKHIRIVIGMSQVIGDAAAITFAIGFYKALGAGRTFEDAYNFARVEIRLQGIPEYLTPVLYVNGEIINPKGYSIARNLEVVRGWFGLKPNIGEVTQQSIEHNTQTSETITSSSFSLLTIKFWVWGILACTSCQPIPQNNLFERLSGKPDPPNSAVLLFLICILAMVCGLIQPNSVVRFGNPPKRWVVILIYFPLTVIFACLAGAT
jgi:CHAT domain